MRGETARDGDERVIVVDDKPGVVANVPATVVLLANSIRPPAARSA